MFLRHCFPSRSLCPGPPPFVTFRGRLRMTLTLRTPAQLAVTGRPSVWQSAPLPASVGVTTGQSGWPRRCFIATSRSLTRPRLPVTGRPISRLRLVLPLAGCWSPVTTDTRSWKSSVHLSPGHPAPPPGRSRCLAVRLPVRHGLARHPSRPAMIAGQVTLTLGHALPFPLHLHPRRSSPSLLPGRPSPGDPGPPSGA